MIGRYGKRKINSLTEAFTNNQGIVTDKEGLADVVWEMYGDQWVKSYNAITLAYNPILPSRNSKTTTQTDERDISEVTDQDVTGSIGSETESSATNTRSTSETTSTDAKATDSGSDTVAASRTGSIDSTSTDSGSDTDSRTVNVDEDTTVTQSGSDGVTGSSSTSGTMQTKTNLPSGNEEVDLGTTHTISSEDRTGNSSTESVVNNSVAPYDTANMKSVATNSSSSDTSTTGNHTLAEVTLDKSIVDGSSSNSSSSSSTTTYGKVSSTDSDVDTTESSTTTYGKVNTVDTDTSDTSSETTTYGKEHTVDSDTTVTGTESNTASSKSGNTVSTTNATDKTVTTNDDLSRTITEEESGNKWWQTPQELIDQELALRRKNIYDQIVKDVVGLLTISIYNMEEM